MSFLAPLYALGILAVVAPILFHLIRRAPKGRVSFSSLMFLSPTPPRFSRRSRLDNILLLILRATALILLAVAFMRPFFRSEAALDPSESEARRVTILLDTSASMRREGLWQRATEEAEQVLAELRPRDQLAIYAFDQTLRPILDIEESVTLDAPTRLAIARERLGSLEPTWGRTELGGAISEVIHSIQDGALTEQASAASQTRIVLISDLQEGTRLESLRGLEWPADVELELKPVTDRGGNASLNLLVDRVGEPPSKDGPTYRVRVFSDPDMPSENFTLNGKETKAKAYVPAGESRVVRVPQKEGALNEVFELKGDVHTFDNRLFVANPGPRKVTILYVGDDGPNQPSGLRYYLERVLGNSRGRTVSVVTPDQGEWSLWENVRPLPLVVMRDDTSPEALTLLKRYLSEGGTLVYVLTADSSSQTVADLAGVDSWDIEEGSVARYAMLRDINFDHPIFAPLAGPLYSDFTKVHFWKYRRVPEDQLGESRVLARFEGGDPAIIEKSIEQGKLIVFTSGWHPEDSELARSSKFLPLMTAILERRMGRRELSSQVHVGDRVPLPSLAGISEDLVVTKPDETQVTLPAGTEFFTETDEPGFYRMTSTAGTTEFAVNLDPVESKTIPMPMETFEQLGVRLVNRGSEADEVERQRQMRDVELESSQQVWRWLLLAAIGVLLIETSLAGWLSQSRSDHPEGGTP